jgi:hypothetical protein
MSMNPTNRLAQLGLAGCALLGLCACSTASSATKLQQPRGAHELTCRYVGLEAVTGPNDTNSDAVTLLAVYRFAEPNVPPPKKPLSMKFQVSRSRTRELQDYLESRPEVICTSEDDKHYTVSMEPLGDFHGEPQR